MNKPPHSKWSLQSDMVTQTAPSINQYHELCMDRVPTSSQMGMLKTYWVRFSGLCYAEGQTAGFCWSLLALKSMNLSHHVHGTKPFGVLPFAAQQQVKKFPDLEMTHDLTQRLFPTYWAKSSARVNRCSSIDFSRAMQISAS